jgi:hypothetical protein
MEKNKTTFIVLLFTSIFLLDALVLYFMYSKKPTPYIITQQNVTPLTMNSEINYNMQALNEFYYYIQTPAGIKFYNLKGGVMYEKSGTFKVFGLYDSTSKYLLSSDKTLYTLDLKKKDLQEILIANQEIISATVSPDKKLINYSILKQEKNSKGKIVKETGEIWQYENEAKTSKLIATSDLGLNANLFLLGWNL